MGAIDVMFKILGDPLQFLNVDLIFKTKLLFLFAILSYIVPIATILSPGALTGVSPKSNLQKKY